MADRSRLVIGTRGSMLALAQTELVASALRASHPGLEVLVKSISTRGDATQTIDRPTAAIGGKGLFTAELESALRAGVIDIAIHSAKDLPAELADGTAILATPRREDARDALIVGTDELAPGSLATIPLNATFGCGSLRRIGQLRSLRPDLMVQPIRGNVETRIRKVRAGQFAATLLAVAGLKRVNLLHHAAAVLPIEQMMPAAGQGALAIQGRADDDATRALLAAMDDEPTRRAVSAERLVVAMLAGGCNMPLGVYADLVDARLVGRAVLVPAEGHPRIEASACADRPDELAEQLVEQLLSRGGREIIDG
jgi:hydroxymethylbilane synthase